MLHQPGRLAIPTSSTIWETIISRQRISLAIPRTQLLICSSIWCLIWTSSRSKIMWNGSLSFSSKSMRLVVSHPASQRRTAEVIPSKMAQNHAALYSIDACSTKRPNNLHSSSSASSIRRNSSAICSRTGGPWHMPNRTTTLRQWLVVSRKEGQVKTE